MNGQELIAALKKIDISARDLGNEDLPESPIEEESIGAYDVVEDERYNEEYHVVYHFIDHNIYLRVVGTYASQIGTDFDDSDIEVVVPQERTITEFKRV